MAQDHVRAPGFVHGWGSAIFKIGDDRINGIVKFGYGDKRTHAKGYGAGRHHAPSRRSPGKYEVDACTTEVYKETAQAIRERLAAASSDGRTTGNTLVQIELIATEPAMANLHVTLHDAVLTGDKSDHSEGPEGLMDALEWDVMYIDRDGLTLADQSEGGLV